MDQEADLPKCADDIHNFTIKSWNKLASFYSEKHGTHGNIFHQQLVSPVAEKLLDIVHGQSDINILEIGCGSGVFARKLAELGCRSVLATDFSEEFLKIAISTTTEIMGNNGIITFMKLDATIQADIVALGLSRFEKVVCNMAIMDMSDIDALFSGVYKVLNANGTFVITVLHPCFNGLSVQRGIEENWDSAEYTPYLKITKYLKWTPSYGIGIEGQPEKQLYFYRPLHELTSTALKHGFVIDGLEEPVFTFTEEQLAEKRNTIRIEKTIESYNFTQFPMILGLRFKKV